MTCSCKLKLLMLTNLPILATNLKTNIILYLLFSLPPSFPLFLSFFLSFSLSLSLSIHFHFSLTLLPVDFAQVKSRPSHYFVLHFAFISNQSVLSMFRSTSWISFRDIFPLSLSSCFVFFVLRVVCRASITFGEKQVAAESEGTHFVRMDFWADRRLIFVYVSIFLPKMCLSVLSGAHFWRIIFLPALSSVLFAPPKRAPICYLRCNLVWYHECLHLSSQEVLLLRS